MLLRNLEQAFLSMRRFLNPFTFLVTLIVVTFYAYASLRLTSDFLPRLVLAIPFFLIWIVPLLYWVGRRDGSTILDNFLHMGGYLSMGWLSFLFTFLILRDLLWLVATVAEVPSAALWLMTPGNIFVFVLATLTLFVGFFQARKGPFIREVKIPIANLPSDLEGYRIVQISDLHVGSTIKKDYVEHMVQLTRDLKPDLIVLTGDIVDGSVEALGPHVAPLAELTVMAPSLLALGNHDYYAGAKAWTQHFTDLGMKVLLNSHLMIKKNSTQILVGGVLDPAVKMTDPSLKPDAQAAMQFREPGTAMPESSSFFRLLLAHHPKIAAEAAAAGFDLQLSGHTHAGQFMPWTWVVRLVHQPHFAGLTKEKNMWVYVSAGTGTWGPPIRFGTKPELTLIQLSKNVSKKHA